MTEPTPVRTPGTDGFAIASFVVGVLGGILISILLGVIALRRIRLTGQGGRGLAIAGFVLSGLWAAVLIVGIATS